MYIKVRTGLKLINPRTYEPVPEAGIEVDDYDLYWIKIISDGDAEVVDSQEGVN